MDIDLGAITKAAELRQPTAEELETHTARVLAHCDKQGLERNTLVVETAPHLGRLLHDFRHMSLVGWSASTGAYDRMHEPTHAIETRGMYLAGKLGTGKTTMLQIAKAISGAVYITASELATLYERGGADAVAGRLGHLVRRDMIIDDLGSEPDKRSFGNTGVVEQLLCDRYDQWRRYGTRLHISTNLTRTKAIDGPDGIAERYGARVLERLMEMCIPIAATGQNMRDRK